MILVDLNILLYATDRRAAHHRAVLDWWQDAITAGQPVGFAWLVLTGFLRLSTNPRAFPTPLSVEAAISKIDAWLSLDNARIVRERDDHWPALRSLVLKAGTAGNLTSDAHLAALAVTHGATLVSCDADFARFEGLRWMNPLAPSRSRR